MEKSEDDLVKAWTAFYEADPEIPRREDDPNQWASDSLMLLELKDPERTLNFIIKIANYTSNENALGALSAGPLESILARYGERVIDTVERLAETDPKFQNLLGGVWRNAMTDAIWRRVLILQERAGHEH